MPELRPPLPHKQPFLPILGVPIKIFIQTGRRAESPPDHHFLLILALAFLPEEQPRFSFLSALFLTTYLIPLALQCGGRSLQGSSPETGVPSRAWSSIQHVQGRIQGSTNRRALGLVNFVPALAYHFCLNFPAAFTEPGARLLVEPCT